MAIGLVLVGALAYGLLPVSPLPQVDFPTIRVSASLPGASPETMAANVAAPLERALGSIAGVTGIYSDSRQGATSVTLEFALDRRIDEAARDVQAAINAARGDLPAGMPRLTEQVSGYVGTCVRGQFVTRAGEDTDARPGRILRGGAA